MQSPTPSGSSPRADGLARLRPLDQLVAFFGRHFRQRVEFIALVERRAGYVLQGGAELFAAMGDPTNGAFSAPSRIRRRTRERVFVRVLKLSRRAALIASTLSFRMQREIDRLPSRDRLRFLRRAESVVF